MRILKHVAALVGVLLFFVYSLVMLRRVLGVAAPWLALLGMFYLLALAKVAEPLFALQLPAALRRLRPWERRSGAYRGWAVSAYGRVLRGSVLRYLNLAVYLDRQAGDLRQVRRLAASAEAAHVWAGGLLLPFIVLAWWNGQWLAATGLALAEILVNLYPILHLRLVRARLDRAIDRQRAPLGSTPPPGVV